MVLEAYGGLPTPEDARLRHLRDGETSVLRTISRRTTLTPRSSPLYKTPITDSTARNSYRETLKQPNLVVFLEFITAMLFRSNLL